MEELDKKFIIHLTEQVNIYYFIFIILFSFGCVGIIYRRFHTKYNSNNSKKARKRKLSTNIN